MPPDIGHSSAGDGLHGTFGVLIPGPILPSLFECMAWRIGIGIVILTGTGDEYRENTFLDVLVDYTRSQLESSCAMQFKR